MIYSTADGQTVDQEVPMTLPEGDYRHQCRLPPGNLGLQQDITYYLAAGDCKTLRYGIESQVAPTIVVDSFLPPSCLHRHTIRPSTAGRPEGDRKTEVAIHATANGEIKPGTAEIDLGCTGQQGLRMSADGRTAAGRFTLRLNPKDASRPEYDSYQLRFADVQGRENKRPIRHRVEVIRDLPPEVRLVEPQQEEVQVAVDGKLTIEVLAEDPDFALRRVTLRAEHDQRSLPIAPLLEKRKSERAWPGEFSATYTFEPARLGLKAGDRVEYWVEAEDNKEPAPGRAASGKQWISVVRADAHKAATGGRDGETASGGRDDDKAATGGRAESSGDATGDKPPSGEGQSDQREPESAEQPKAAQSDPLSRASTDKEGPANRAKRGQQQGKEQSPDQQQVAQTSENPTNGSTLTPTLAMPCRKSSTIARRSRNNRRKINPTRQPIIAKAAVR